MKGKSEMNIVLSGISILTGFLIGCIAAARMSAELKNLSELYDALETLKNHICTYSSGLHEAIVNGELDKKCALFSVIAEKLTIRRTDGVFSEAIDGSPYNSEIKMSLLRLFDAISQSEEAEIRKNFDITIITVQKYKNEAQIKKEKDAPLCKKVGLLVGIGAAILII